MLNELIEKRWSTRAFSDQALSREQVEKLLLAASKAPSAFNEQPWRFVVGHKGDAIHEKLSAGLSDNNKLWAPQAPLLVLLLAKRTWSHNGEPNPNGAYDAGQAAAYLTLQAAHDELFVHQMGGFDRQKTVETLAIDPDFQPLVVIAIGYKGQGEYLPAPLLEREKIRQPRKPVEELVIQGW